jgi:CRP-like cAMP-binding protein
MAIEPARRIVMNHCLDCGRAEHVCARNVPIFASLGPEELLEVNSLIQSAEYAKEELLFRQGDTGTHLFIVRSGRVKLYSVSSEGRQQILRILESGEFFGELALFHDTQQYCFAEAMESTQVCLINQSDFQDLLKRKPTVALALLQAMGARLSQAERFISDLTLKTVEERIVSWLLMRAQTAVKRGDEITVNLDLSREELAHLLGTTIETVSRRLSSLQAEGLVTLHGHRSIVLKDLDGLEGILAQ